jgi:predicted  nucleic acid-binding Zn-ribbon protein
MRRLRLVGSLLALSVVVLAGCGGGSKEDFERDIVAARDRTDAALTQVTRAKSIDDLLERLRIAATEIRGAATDVREADAPDDLGDEEQALEEALRTLSDEIVGVVDTFSENQEAIANAQGFNFAAWDTVQARLRDLREEGIDVPPLERLKAPTP